MTSLREYQKLVVTSLLCVSTLGCSGVSADKPQENMVSEQRWSKQLDRSSLEVVKGPEGLAYTIETIATSGCYSAGEVTEEWLADDTLKLEASVVYAPSFCTQALKTITFSGYSERISATNVIADIVDLRSQSRTQLSLALK